MAKLVLILANQISKIWEISTLQNQLTDDSALSILRAEKWGYEIWIIRFFFILFCCISLAYLTTSYNDFYSSMFYFEKNMKCAKTFREKMTKSLS